MSGWDTRHREHDVPGAFVDQQIVDEGRVFGAIIVKARARPGCCCTGVCGVGKCPFLTCPIVLDGAGAYVAGATRIDGCQCEGFRHFVVGVIGDSNAHQQIGRFIGRTIAIARHLDKATCCVSGPLGAVPVLQCVGVIDASACRPCSQSQLNVLVFFGADCEHAIRRAFVDGDVIHCDRSIVVAQSRQAACARGLWCA